MLRLPLLLALLLTACPETLLDDDDSTAPAPAATPAPTPAPLATPAPTPSPAELTGDPWVQKASLDGTTWSDQITFWGFNKEGTTYAFSTVAQGPGATSCEGRHDLYVVDATTDTYAEKGRVTVKHASPEPPDGKCDPPNLPAAFKPARDAALKAHGIIRGHHRGPNRYTKTAPDLWSATLPDGSALALRFSVQSPGREAVMAGGKASYRLQSKAADGSWTNIEAGTRGRTNVHDYGLGDGWTFFSPDGGHGALFVSKTLVAFEGNRRTWMSNGIKVPAAAP